MNYFQRIQSSADADQIVEEIKEEESVQHYYSIEASQGSHEDNNLVKCQKAPSARQLSTIQTMMTAWPHPIFLLGLQKVTINSLA